MLFQSLLDLHEASDAKSFEEQLVKIAHRMDFGLVLGVVVHEVPGGQAQIARIGNTPKAFLAASLDSQSLARDPVHKRQKTLSVPVIYDQRTYVDAGAPDLWEEQAPFGYRTGIAVGLHLPGQRHFMLGLDREDPLPKDDEKIMRMLGDLQLLAAHAHEPAMRLFSKPASSISLSPREQQILLMTMEGKSAKVIGAEIHCTESTVNFHLHNVRIKFEVTSKHQAALKARALGLI